MLGTAGGVRRENTIIKYKPKDERKHSTLDLMIDEDGGGAVGRKRFGKPMLTPGTRIQDLRISSPNRAQGMPKNDVVQSQE
jgi:hypothetical protein